MEKTLWVCVAILTSIAMLVTIGAAMLGGQQ